VSILRNPSPCSPAFGVALGVALGGLLGCDDRGGTTTGPAPGMTPGTTPTGPPARDGRAAQQQPSGAAAQAYGQALEGLRPEHRDEARAGHEIFVATWVARGDGEAARLARGPAAPVREGLGPLFNATSCQGCHFAGGRGQPPPDLRRPAEAHDAAYLAPAGPTRVLRIGVVGPDGPDGPDRQDRPGGVGGQLASDPTYGLQLQDRALPEHAPEGRFSLEPRHVKGHYGDGTGFALESLVPVIRALRGPPMPRATKLSLRIPQSLIGLGLLEAVPEAAIVARADPGDVDRDGISGRASRVIDPISGELVLGRFGWKASQPSVRAQSALAAREDLGVSTSRFPDAPCAPAPPDGKLDACLGAALGVTCAPPGARACAAGGAPELPELSDLELERLTRYLRLLEPPARRDASDPEVRRGEALFTSVGCAACHRPSLQTGEVTDLPELSRRTIAPYSDLLLHAMGDGLADSRPEGGATGREWRTAPLWGLGLLGRVSGEVHLLHDGRARTFAEAILWHGGEAMEAREEFRRLEAGARAALLRFLSSL
jgi:CxxC motif-containing protein (DUF1111 family)